MGVPGFFAWILKNCRNNNVIVPTMNLNNCYLFIDGNCLVHPECYEVLAFYNKKCKISKEQLEKAMFKRIIAYIEFLIQVSGAKKVYIAIDGVAPLAKISQQRKRRFKSNYEREFKNKLKLKYQIEADKNEWDNTCITPGTIFMESLHRYLLDYSNKKGGDMIYSSCYESGEGEHKILQYIKNTDLLNYTIAIYGLDADLIFLSLASGINNIFLLREESEVNKIKPCEQSEDINIVSKKMIYISIEQLSLSIVSIFENRYLKDAYGADKICMKSNLIRDFIFLCYLLGNDFLPHIPGLHIREGGLDMIIETYSKIKGDNFLVDDNYDINYGFLRMLLYNLRDKIIKNKDRKIFIKKTPEFSSNYDKEVWEFDNLRHKKLGSWLVAHDKNEYYDKFFGSDKGIDSVSKEYIRGLKWVTEYYFKKVVSWSWQYPFTHGPYLDEVCLYFDADFTFVEDSPLTPYQQLLTVLPPAKYDLLPNTYHYLTQSLSSPIIDMYPIKFSQDKTDKMQQYECIPLIPIIDRSRIIDATFNL